MVESALFPQVVCPEDSSNLMPESDAALLCGKGHRFPVRLGIPRLVPESNYADAFGAQWHHYRLTQLDSYTGTHLSRDRLRRCLGEEVCRELERPDGRLQVLEAGCGAGRFTEVLLQLPAAFVTSTDLSSAVEPNQTNCPQSNRHRILQCDIWKLPFRPQQYDVVICLGVIQHTKDPETTIAKLYEQVRPGGWLVIDHYERSFKHHTRFGELLLRPVLKRLSRANGMAMTKTLTRWFFPLHRAARHVPPARMLLSRFSPLLTYFHAFPELNDRQQYEWAELDTHDSLTDWYKHVRSPRAIRTALESLGSQNIWVTTGGNGIEARCQKPRQSTGS
jgi:2-polyprenyl-3-methyl-5-hydroxy-6-metoxy-1,4-benzoquinol methylase